ncbi:MAG: hypothetical protein IKG00_00080 [Lachnospiraceae bacterium]|nr:hypothetical protein [Lachnospiraceae bacterium]
MSKKLKLTREDLSQYQSLIIARDSLTGQIKEYDQLSRSDHTGRAARRIRSLEAQQKIIDERMEEIENFVDSIEDPEIRTICSLHYLDGLTWEATCIQVRKHSSAAVITRKIEAFFDE